jgi:hypothetical protein
MPVEQPAMRIIRRLMPYTAAGAVLAVLYVVWVFADRWSENRRMEQTATEAQRAKTAKEIPGIEGKLKILNFYVTPGVIQPGQNALVCYGVVNATAVRLDPPVERVYPSLNRCFEVSPRRKTRYTVTAEDAQGHTATESFVLEVK